MRIDSISTNVLRGFIAKSNEQYRSAGLSQFQMRVERDGSVTIPGVISKRGRPNSQLFRNQKNVTNGRSGASGARRGANIQSVSPPQISSIKKTNDGFAIQWQPVDGAMMYGVWIDGQLAGNVKDPSFSAAIAAGKNGTIQIDAVTKGGTRTQRTPRIVAERTATGELKISAAQA